MSEAHNNENASATAETAIKYGADALKAGFDKAVQNYDAALGFNKGNVEAVLKAAAIASDGAEIIHNELYAYSKQSVEDTLAASTAIWSSKSIHEAFERQNDFAKAALEAYVGQITKFGTLFTATAKDSFAPLQGRAQTLVEAAQKGRTA
jgi:phasin family protein